MKRIEDAGLKYCKKLNFWQPRDPKKGVADLQKKYGLNVAKDIVEVANMQAKAMSDPLEMERFINNTDMYYSKKNKSFDVAMGLAELIDTTYYRTICNFIDKNRDSFGHRILDAGCENGIITCFLGLTFPEAEIVGVDRCEEAIKVAKELAEKLNITNVSFEACDVEEYKSEPFDTVFACCLLDNVYNKIEYNAFGSAYEVSQPYMKGLKPIITALSSLVAPGGIVMTADLFDYIQVTRIAEIGDFYEQNVFLQKKDGLEFTVFDKHRDVTILTYRNLTGTDDADEFIKKLNIQAESDLEVMNRMSSLAQPYYEDDVALKGRVLFSRFCHDVLEKSNGMFKGMLASVALEEMAGDMVEEYRIYEDIRGYRIVCSLWKNRMASDVYLYFGAELDGSAKAFIFQAKPDEAIDHLHKQTLAVYAGVDNSYGVERMTRVYRENGQIREEKITVDMLK